MEHVRRIAELWRNADDQERRAREERDAAEEKLRQARADRHQRATELRAQLNVQEPVSITLDDEVVTVTPLTVTRAKRHGEGG